MYLAPIILLMGTFLSCFFDYNFVIVGNVLGYSLATNFVFIGVFTFGNFCIFTRLSPIGLLLINLVDIFDILINDLNFLDSSIINFKKFDYVKIFTISICSIVLFLVLVFNLERKIYKK